MEAIRHELDAMLTEESKRSLYDSFFQMITCLEDTLDALGSFLDYEPSDKEMGGEPPMTLSEMDAAA